MYKNPVGNMYKNPVGNMYKNPVGNMYKNPVGNMYKNPVGNYETRLHPLNKHFFAFAILDFFVELNI